MQEAEAGSLDLYALDESGFLPTWPTSYTWARQGARARVPYQASEGRRVNAIGAVAPRGPQPRLVWRSSPGKLDSAVFLDFLWRDVAGLPAPPDELPAGYCRSRPCVVVLDNYSVHKSGVVKAARPQLEAAGVILHFLPPYSPELNPMELVWRHAKYETAPIRSYQDLDALHAAVDQTLAAYAQHLSNPKRNLREAA